MGGHMRYKVDTVSLTSHDTRYYPAHGTTLTISRDSIVHAVILLIFHFETSCREGMSHAQFLPYCN